MAEKELKPHRTIYKFKKLKKLYENSNKDKTASLDVFILNNFKQIGNTLNWYEKQSFSNESAFNKVFVWSKIEYLLMQIFFNIQK